jgi:hypothetical protein
MENKTLALSIERRDGTTTAMLNTRETTMEHDIGTLFEYLCVDKIERSAADKWKDDSGSFSDRVMYRKQIEVSVGDTSRCFTAEDWELSGSANASESLAYLQKRRKIFEEIRAWAQAVRKDNFEIKEELL